MPNGMRKMDEARINAILAPVPAAENERRERRVRERFWRTVKRAARQVPFMDEVVAAYYCALDRDTPAGVRATLLAALAYFVLPFDFVPDLLAMVGFTDDMAVLMAAIAALGPNVKERHRIAARHALEDL